MPNKNNEDGKFKAFQTWFTKNWFVDDCENEEEFLKALFHPYRVDCRNVEVREFVHIHVVGISQTFLLQ